MKFRPQSINVVEWVQILPKIVALVSDVIAALKDGRVDDAEVKRIGSDLVAIVAAVV